MISLRFLIIQFQTNYLSRLLSDKIKGIVHRMVKLLGHNAGASVIT